MVARVSSKPLGRTYIATRSAVVMVFVADSTWVNSQAKLVFWAIDSSSYILSLCILDTTTVDVYDAACVWEGA